MCYAQLIGFRTWRFLLSVILQAAQHWCVVRSFVTFDEASRSFYKGRGWRLLSWLVVSLWMFADCPSDWNVIGCCIQMRLVAGTIYIVIQLLSYLDDCLDGWVTEYFPLCSEHIDASLYSALLISIPWRMLEKLPKLKPKFKLSTLNFHHALSSLEVALI